MKLLVDGKIREDKKTDIDTGYFYGFGVFETILVREGTAVLAQAHLDRLNDGLERIHIPKRLEMTDIEKAIALLMCWNGALKVNVSEKHTVFTARAVTYTADQYENGAELFLTGIRRNPTSPSVYIKSMNYMDNLLAMKEAKEEGCQDALFINHEGYICETAVANIFFIQEGQIITPAVTNGLLNGVVRQWLLGKLSVAEKDIPLTALADMDGAFITNSLMGIMRVSKIGDVTYEDHEMIHRVAKQYVEMLREEA